MKKTFTKILSVVLCAVMVLGAAPLGGFVGFELPSLFDFKAEAATYSGTCGDNLTWSLDTETGVLNITGTGVMTSSPWYSYRSYIKTVNIGNSVTTIGKQAFASCNDLTSVTIPDSITTIGEQAFASCNDLTSVTIPGSVTTIGDNAFYNCDSLTSITIPNSVTSIGEGAFGDCDSLTNITVDDNNKIYTSDSYGVLFNKDKKTLVQYPIGNTKKCYTIPDSVTTVGSYAFYDCDIVSNVTIPDSVTTIGDFAFYHCSSLTSVTIPGSVTTIGDNAFYNCDSLTSITIPESVRSIGEYAFYGCNSLTSVTIPASVTIPDSVTTIGDYAFSNCNSLTSITIPDSVTTIDYGAFMNCNSLTSITIPDSVTTIGSYAFRSCDSLADVYYGGTEAQWKKIAIGSRNDPLKNATIHYNSAGGNPTPDNPNELTLVSTYPANGATQLAYDDDLALTFNMNVERNLSTLNEDGICIGIYDYKTDELVKSFDELYVGYKHSGKTMTFEDAFRKLEPGKKYYIKIADDAICSKTADKTLIYKGINNKDQWSFSYLNPTQKQGYSLDIYSSDRAITVSKGETQQVSVVLSLDGKPCKQDGISLSVANNGVAEISKIERENDRTVVTLKGLKNGTTTVTVTDNGSKTVQTFPVFVTDEASVYYFTDVEKYTEYNPMILDDMFIDSFKHKKNNNGSYTVTFDVYNMGHSCGAVDVYDKNGNVVDSQIIELFDSDYPTDLFSHAEYAGKLVGNFALDIITGDLLYSVKNIKSDLNSKQTSVSITVPENGYYVITKNVTVSNSCLLYNAFTLALDVAFESVGLIVDATDVSEELAQGVLSKNVDKYLKKICETFIEKGALLSAKNASVMAENLIIDVEYLFEAMGTTFIDAVIEAVPKVTTKITKDQAAKVFFGMSLKKCGKDIVDNILYGSIKAAKWLTICQNIYDYRNSNGAYVYASQNGNTKTSNGVIAKSDSDAQTVFHSILVTSGYYSDYIDAMHRPEADAELYSISMIKNGQKVQPSSPVTIYIPIPDGWGSEKIYIYHIKDNFEREELEGTIENGYIKFVTNGFSYFVIANDVVNFIDEFSIKPYSIATVNYGDTLVLQADLGEATLPEGWSIQWTVEGSGFNMTTEENGMKCKFTSVANGNATIKATLVNESDEAILDAEDNEISNEITLKSNASFWQKIVSFFKNLFRMNRIIY